jgi:hypothetical protein
MGFNLAFKGLNTFRIITINYFRVAYFNIILNASKIQSLYVLHADSICASQIAQCPSLLKTSWFIPNREIQLPVSRIT